MGPIWQTSSVNCSYLGWIILRFKVWSRLPCCKTNNDGEENNLTWPEYFSLCSNSWVCLVEISENYRRKDQDSLEILLASINHAALTLGWSQRSHSRISRVSRQSINPSTLQAACNWNRTTAVGPEKQCAGIVKRIVHTFKCDNLRMTWTRKYCRLFPTVLQFTSHEGLSLSFSWDPSMLRHSSSSMI